MDLGNSHYLISGPSVLSQSVTKGSSVYLLDSRTIHVRTLLSIPPPHGCCAFLSTYLPTLHSNSTAHGDIHQPLQSWDYVPKLQSG